MKQYTVIGLVAVVCVLVGWELRANSTYVIRTRALEIVDHEGNVRLWAGVQDGRGAQVLLHDPGGQLVTSLSGDSDNSALTFYDPVSGAPLVLLGSTVKGPVQEMATDGGMLAMVTMKGEFDFWSSPRRPERPF